MIYGLHPDVYSMLDKFGGPKQFIIKFNVDYTNEALYEWDEVSRLWKLIENQGEKNNE